MARRGVGFPILLLCPVILLVAVGCREAEQPLDEVTVQLAWYHQAQFAGFYAADQNGYYAEEGLDVALRPSPGPGTDIPAVVGDGEGDFGIVTGAALVPARASGVPVTAVAVIQRRSPTVFMTLADSGIRRPADLPGRTIRKLDPGSAPIFAAMMRSLGLDPATVHEVDVGFSLDAFTRGEVDTYSAYLTSVVVSARAQGLDINVIYPDDYGVHLYGDTLFTSDRLIRENPDLVLRFVRATLRGLRWAVENAEEAGQLSLEYDPTLDADHQVGQMKVSLPLIHTGEDQIGWMRTATWQGTLDILVDQGLLTGAVDVDDVYTMEFLYEVYGEQER